MNTPLPGRVLLSTRGSICTRSAHYCRESPPVSPVPSHPGRCGGTASPARSNTSPSRSEPRFGSITRPAEFERQTRPKGRQDGALGRNGLAVLHALLFDFLNYASGRLDPSYARIADKACISIRSVARGLVSLKARGVLHWLRRCREDHDEAGRFRLRQESNAYAVLPASQWRGYLEPEPPPLEAWQLGAAPPLLDALDQAALDVGLGNREAAIAALTEGDPLDAALARLGRAITGMPGRH